MRLHKQLIPAILIGLLPVTAVAQDDPEAHPGYFPLHELGIVEADASSVDINLRGAMLRLVGAAVLQEEPALANLVSDLAAIRVLVTPTEGLDPARVDQALARGVSALESGGWQRVVRVREAEEQVHLYVREVDGSIEGLTLFVFEPSGELTLINLVGRLDVEQLVSLGEAFDIPSLESALEGQRPPATDREEPPRRRHE